MSIPFKLAYNTSFQLLGKVVTVVSTTIVFYLIVIPNFSVGEFGILNSILSYVALFYVFADFGLNAIFVREVGADQNKQKEFFKKLFGLRLVVAILISFIATASLAFVGYTPAVKAGILIALGLIIAQTFSITTLALFQAKIRYDLAFVADLFWAVANVVFVFIAVRLTGGLLFVIAALVIGNAAKVLVSLYLVRFQLGEISLEFDREFWRRFLLAALPIGLIAIFSQFNAQIDKQIVLLARYSPGVKIIGADAAGFYGFAYKIFELAIVIPTFIMNVGYPIMVQKREEGIRVLIGFSKKMIGGLFFIGFICLLFGWFAAPFIFDISIFQKFSISLSTIRILLIGFPLFFITPVTLWLAITLKKHAEMLFIYAFAAAFNLVANLVFIPKFGYNAAAVVTIASELLILILSASVLFIELKLNKT